MNYRSVVIYGQFERIPEEYKASALERFVQRVGAGREHEVRPPDPTELAATTILYIPTTEAAAKIRVGGPKDDEADLTRPVWSGVLPMRTQQCEPVREADSAIEAPDYVRSWPGDRFPSVPGEFPSLLRPRASPVPPSAGSEKLSLPVST